MAWDACQLKLVSRVVPITGLGRMCRKRNHRQPHVLSSLIHRVVSVRSLKRNCLNHVSQVLNIDARQSEFHNCIEVVPVKYSEVTVCKT